MNKKIVIFSCLIIMLTLITCNPFRKSWSTVYQEQKELFTANRQTFHNAAIAILKTELADTMLPTKDRELSLSNRLIVDLKNLGINRVEVISRYADPDCYGRELRFIPDSLWNFERFSVLLIQYNRCDTRSQNGAHWVDDGSDHKHAFGMGSGFLIYSDTDRDPF